VGFERQSVSNQLSELACEGVYVGTSSWKYPGWRGKLYDDARYVYRGKFAESRFERNCLAEYAEVFKTVCVDAAYYKFPDEKYLRELTAQVPADFRFAFKVTDEITIKRFTNLPRFGVRAGTMNAHFLDAELFKDRFLRPCEPFQESVGLMMFEFSRFHASDYGRGREFLNDLDRFLSALPKGLPYGVEMRNREWLLPEYFNCLTCHGVTHIFNSWEAMPPVSEQMDLANSITNPNLVAARFLLRPGRRYEEAVKMFQPYQEPKEPNLEARGAGRKLIAMGKAKKNAGKTLIYVNNRLEGNALETIAGMIG
jgi:uncharacterized protein YecE (DUF72 family)